MSRSLPPLSPEVRALLDLERSIPPQPAPVRARTLARARAALAAEPRPAAAATQTVSRWRWAFAAALICLAGTAAGAAAYRIAARLAPTSRPASSPPLVQPTPAVSLRPAAAHDLPTLPARSALAPQRLSEADAARAELQLLRWARAAVARQDFAAALPPLAQHALRFRNGRLAEEREALRVKALAGLGRRDEARRAAAAFEERFPRSVLLPAVIGIGSPAP